MHIIMDLNWNSKVSVNQFRRYFNNKSDVLIYPSSIPGYFVTSSPQWSVVVGVSTAA